MKTGKLIVFEGADEVGKTTLATMLAEELRSGGTTCELVSFPGTKNGTLGRHINDLHHDPTSFQVRQINPTSLQAMHIAAHIDAIDGQIIPALKKGQIVILDRYWWSAWIYGVANGADKVSLEALLRAEATHWKGILPSHFFLVTRSQPLKVQGDIQLWNRINQAYKTFASTEKRKYPVHVIQNESTREEAFAAVRKHLGALSK